MFLSMQDKRCASAWALLPQLRTRPYIYVMMKGLSQELCDVLVFYRFFEFIFMLNISRLNFALSILSVEVKIIQNVCFGKKLRCKSVCTDFCWHFIQLRFHLSAVPLPFATKRKQQKSERDGNFFYSNTDWTGFKDDHVVTVFWQHRKV
jgi:hypothetical protein